MPSDVLPLLYHDHAESFLRIALKRNGENGGFRKCEANFFSDGVVPFLRDDDGGCADDGVGHQKFYRIPLGIVGEEQKWLCGNRESVVDHGATRIGENIRMCVGWQGVGIISHGREVFIEGAPGVLVVGKKEEVFTDIPEGNASEDGSGKEHHADSGARLSSSEPFAKPEQWDARDKKDGRLRADSAKGMRQSFCGQKFGNEHGEEPSEEEERNHEFAISFGMLPSFSDEQHDAHNEKNESSEKQYAAHQIEERIGRIVVPPVHIAHKGVFDQRKTKCFGEREGEVSVIDRGRENRNRCRS